MVSCRQACPFCEEGPVGLQHEGLLCILGKEALSEMDTWLMEHFAFAFLPSQALLLPLCPLPPISPPLGQNGAYWETVWGAMAWLVSRGKERRGHI